MGLKEIGVNAKNWIDSAQNRDWRALFNAALNLQASQVMGLIVVN
jgi:hypothetical protein